jgi:hypothetical protein
MIRKARKSKKAFIFGPFIGELYWEMFRFAPYAISLKKRFPNYHLIVFTRNRSFDLYGKYASVLVPLVINEGLYKEEGFKIKGYDVEEYKYLCEYIKRKYEKRYKILDHHAPQILGFMYKVKWQFPRLYMDYDFRPRSENSEIINEVYGDLVNMVVTDNEDIELENYDVISRDKFFKGIEEKCTEKSSIVGCSIELVKKCHFVISNFNRSLARLAVLSGVPVIAVKETYTDDAIYLMNPLQTKVFKCDTVEEGVEKYEDYVRS